MYDDLTVSQHPVLIAGGTGFIGSALIDFLRAHGMSCIVLSRKDGGIHRGVPVWGYEHLRPDFQASAVVNLAGADIAASRWTGKRKQELLDSRIGPTRKLVEWIKTCRKPPNAMVSASAIGYYGSTGEQAATEASAAGDDFGAELCKRWESEVVVPERTRRVILRIGIVLGPGGGALRRMVPPFRFGAGGPIGDGQQWMSWISQRDLNAIILQAITEPWSGVYNATAPEPVRNADFARTLGKVLNRPAVLPLPAFVVRLMFGEMGSILLEPQRVVPKRLLDEGFPFEEPELAAALATAVRPAGAG